MARQLDRGDPFPEFSVKTVAGATLNLPQQLTAEYAVLLFYRGHWWPFCIRQLADFQAYQEQLLRENVEVVALSVDAVDKARQTVEQLGLTFPVAYALDVPRDAEKIGAFWEERRRIFHATSFVLDRDRNVLHACYSTGPIGRISAEEALSSLQFARGRIRPGDTQGLSEYLERIRSSVRQDSMEQKHNGWDSTEQTPDGDATVVSGHIGLDANQPLLRSASEQSDVKRFTPE